MRHWGRKAHMEPAQPPSPREGKDDEAAQPCRVTVEERLFTVHFVVSRAAHLSGFAGSPMVGECSATW